MTTKFTDVENMTVEEAEAVIAFCANHDSEVAFYHKDGKIIREMAFNWDIKNGVTKL